MQLLAPAAGRLQLRATQLLRHFSTQPTLRTKMSFPPTVQAITIAKTGGFEVIQKTTQPFPEIAPGHVVVKARRMENNEQTLSC